MLVSINDYAEHSGLSAKAVRQLIHSGKIPFMNIGKKYLILKEQADKQIEEICNANLKVINGVQRASDILLGRRRVGK